MILCKTFCRNYHCTKSFIPFSGFKNVWKNYIFPIVKMAANYAKINRVGMVGDLDAGFQPVSLVQNFWMFHSIVMVMEH